MPSILKINEATAEYKGVEFALIDAGSGAAITGEAANVDVWLRIGGTGAAGLGTVVELDATNHPGLYAYRLHSTEIDTAAHCVMTPTHADAVTAHYSFSIIPNDPLSAALGAADVTDAVDDSVRLQAVEARTNNLPVDTEQTLVEHLGRLDAIEETTDQIVFSTANRVDVQVHGMEANTVTAAALAADASAEIADAVLDEALAGHTTSGTAGERLGRIPNAAAGASGGLPTLNASLRVSADATAISGDSTAADNLEAAADGTGYNLGGGSIVAASVTGAVGSVSGSVASVAGVVAANVTQLRGDTVAAQNLEADYDGTGYNKSASAIGTTATVGSITDKTGYKLASDGLDSISTTAPTGVATNFREMVIQTWRRFFKRHVYDAGAGTITTYRDDNTTVVTTQATSDVDDVETVGAAS